MQILGRTATVLIWPALASLGAACDRLDTPTATIEAYTIPGGGPGKTTGGGQINVEVNDVAGTATFGFNAKLVGEGTEAVSSGHLNYLNHVTGDHLNCKVTKAEVAPGANKDLTGTGYFEANDCSPNSSAQEVEVNVVDAGEPGDADVFTIEYNGKTDNVQEAPIRSGNIQVHQNQ
jgi:hypothetical protein